MAVFDVVVLLDRLKLGHGFLAVALRSAGRQLRSLVLGNVVPVISPQLDRHIFVDRTGVGFLLGNTHFGE
jgi:hypothetical protein